MSLTKHGGSHCRAGRKCQQERGWSQGELVFNSRNRLQNLLRTVSHVLVAAGQPHLQASPTLLRIYALVSGTCYLWSFLMSSLSAWLLEPINQESSHLCDSVPADDYKTEQSHILFPMPCQCSKAGVTRRVCRASTWLRTPLGTCPHTCGARN